MTATPREISERPYLCDPVSSRWLVTDLGKAVRRGDVVARIHDVERTGGAVTDYRAARDGILAGRHFPGLVQTGDTLAVIGVPAAPNI